MIPATSLVRRTSIDTIEREHAYLVDEAAYKGLSGWKEISRDWAAFKEHIQPKDEIWEYDWIEAHLGFVSGEGGFAIVSNGQARMLFPMYASG